ncbi:MAG: class I tRNA ligase family protein, partial [Planctomycetota bacterium]|nr:class I tRNA ligase family protein [Planctomycetota bacterium]
LEQGLRERAITRDLSWGVPVPLPEAQGKVLYVWFDAPLGYITFTRLLAEQRGQPDAWKKYWQDEAAGLVHFIGKDNTVFHAVIFPAMLLAHGDYRLPDAVVANEFLNLEGDKISTSRNWAIWVDEYLQHFSADPLRYYLTAIAPETSDSDFSWREFQARNNGELADNLGNFIQRNLAFCAKYFEGKVPAAAAGLTAGDSMLQEIEDSRREIAAHLSAFRFRAGLERLMRLSQRGNQFLAEIAPWQLRKRDAAACASAVYVGLRAVEALSIFMAPFLPFAAAQLRRLLRLPALAPGDWQAASRLAPGHALAEPEVLFPKIADEAIEAQIRALRGGEGRGDG